jgi:hypothetical protein
MVHYQPLPITRQGFGWLIQSGGPFFLTKGILVVAHDRPLRATRVSLLEQQGYLVQSVELDNEAMVLLETEAFDLVLIGRKSLLPKKGIDQRLRELYPHLLTLMIVNTDEASIYPSRMTDSRPEHVIEALHEMLEDDVRLIPVDLWTK